MSRSSNLPSCAACGGSGFVHEGNDEDNRFPCPDCGYSAEAIVDRISQEDLKTRIVDLKPPKKRGKNR